MTFGVPPPWGRPYSCYRNVTGRKGILIRATNRPFKRGIVLIVRTLIIKINTDFACAYLRDKSVATNGVEVKRLPDNLDRSLHVRDKILYFGRCRTLGYLKVLNVRLFIGRSYLSSDYRCSCYCTKYISSL